MYGPGQARGRNDSLEYVDSRTVRPCWAYVLLALAISAVSSAALVFKQLEDVAPVTKAAWRLQLTSLIMLPPFLWQYQQATSTERHDALQCWHILAFSGVCLALHFGSWVFGLAHTSLPQSLLFVTSAPLSIAFGSLVLKQPISNGEVTGALAGCAGMLILALGSRSDREVTILGDFFSFLGALAIIGYLIAGKSVRSWMPLFIYVLPVTLLAAIILSVAAVIVEGTRLVGLGQDCLFGYFTKAHVFYVLYLALGPGMLGHTGFNLLLKYFSPFVISMMFPMEPFLGTVLALVFGVEKTVPGPLTWVGGSIVMCAVVYCTFCEQRRLALQERKLAVNRAITSALEGDDALELARLPFDPGDNDVVFENLQ